MIAAILVSLAVLALVFVLALALCKAAARGDRHLLGEGPQEDGTVVYLPRRFRVIEDDRIPDITWPKDAA